MRTVISTVGTSLLTNRAEETPPRAWRGWTPGHALPDQVSAAAYLRMALPALASAETNTLWRLQLEAGDRLVWLASDTLEGRWCAQALLDHYAASGHAGSIRILSGMAYHHGSFTERGLRSLLAETCAAVNEAGGPGYAVICATGGFKAEIAFLNLIGLLLGIDVHYLHEQFKEIVTLPRLPLQWDLAWVEQRRAFFDWIEAEHRPSAEVEQRLRAYPDLRPLVEDDDGYTLLTALGALLWRAFQERTGEVAITWPPASDQAPHQKNAVSEIAHHRPRGWERFVQRLTEIGCVTKVRYAEGLHGHNGPYPRIVSTDPAAGWIGIVYGEQDLALPLRVETTASSEPQLRLVRDWIERNMRKW